MEALKNLVNNVPDWLTKLDELNGQIEKRQRELATLAESEKAKSPNGTSTGAPKSIRNKGSTESLRPHDEPEAHPRESTPQPEPSPEVVAATAEAAAAGAADAKARAEKQAPSSPTGSHSPSGVQKQTNQVRAAGQARARATVQKRRRTDSIISAEGATPKYRSRSMIIVYYDSYVQIFFEELVKFVSASRNMMRKAKMAAKVAQIKKLAEMEAPDDEEDTKVDPNGPLLASGAIEPSTDKDPETGLPKLEYISTRNLMRGGSAAAMIQARAALGRTGYSRAGMRGGRTVLGPDGKPQPGPTDIFDDLDKGLEYVQSMCEHAAHQFLRDGDCAEEVANIQRRLRETKELADKEAERVKKEPPEAPEKSDEDSRGRSYRPPSMRKDNGITGITPDGKLEVDDETDEDEAELPPPKLMFRSTRNMT
ncbi:hypothetical protein QBC38DRAFT_367118 [Podospora fimiseda]|uniref:Uncharacterized protein n=1 Tax=Podospora fimiseda TaxID=252190 RepID=A0AAN7GX73_9PEZI|nr:hypothetical protein QBC38DRAFT_367118 [Podospora fimiseda]